MENKLQETNATTREFKLQLLQHITNNFSEENVIGRGGYGVVYKGVLEDGEEIAVKRLHQFSGLDDKEFRNEFNNLMRAQHKNIVRLIGYCYDIGHQRIKLNGEYIFAHLEERVLCLEYLEGGSLDKYVSDGSCRLDWHTCYTIIRGVSEGLNYLHNGSKDPIYHLDLKPANILLNKRMMPKIGDFGLSRLCSSAKTCTTIKTIGTPGYMPPEYIERCQITSKFDIFSLGVIIIQIMAGREGYFNMADMTSQEFIKIVHENWLKRLHTIVSSHTSHEVKRCIEIALKCVEVDRVKRPTIAEVIDELNKTDTSNGSPPGQVTNSRSKQAFKYASSEERRRSNVEKGRAVWWWRLLPLLWVVAWSFASLWIFIFMNSLVIEKRQELLVNLCDKCARMLQDQIVVMCHVHALGVIVNTFGKFDRENITQATESGALLPHAPFKRPHAPFKRKNDLPATARTQERSRAFCYLGGINIDAYIDDVLQQLADMNSIMMNVYDTTHQRPILMHGSIDTGSCIACISHNSTLSFGDWSRRHEMHCRFTQRSPWPWLAITSSFGTLGTALLVGYRFASPPGFESKLKHT